MGRDVMAYNELVRLARHYIDNNISLRELAAMNGISKPKLVKLFQGKLTPSLPIDLQQQVDAKKEKNWYDGKSTYGNQGHISVSKEQLVLIAQQLILGNFTIKEMTEHCNMNQSTLYSLLNKENIGEELYAKLTDTYKTHKERMNGYGK